jgi:Mn-dependent DtxR family transcriptional regulator
MKNKQKVLKCIEKLKLVHVAEIARELGTPRPTVERWVNRLYQEQVIDFKIIGSARCYFVRGDEYV